MRLALVLWLVLASLAGAQSVRSDANIAAVLSGGTAIGDIVATGTVTSDSLHLPPIAAPGAPHATEDVLFQDSSDSTLKVQKSTAGGGALVDLEAGGGSGTGELVFVRTYTADQLEFPTNSDWFENDGCPLAADTLNAGIKVRLCGDSNQEGFGIGERVPVGATGLIVTSLVRANTAPGVSTSIFLDLAARTMANGAATSAWSSAINLSTITIPTATTWVQTTHTTVPLASLGATAGDAVQLQFVRDVASDSLVGDLATRQIVIEWDMGNDTAAPAYSMRTASGLTDSVPIGTLTLYDTTANAITATLVDCTSSIDGQSLVAKLNTRPGTNNVTLTPEVGDTIDGAATEVLSTEKQARTYFCHGSGNNWILTAEVLP